MRRTPVFFIPLLMIFSLSLPARCEPWTGPDKVRHGAVGSLFGAGALLFISLPDFQPVPEWVRPPVALSLGILPAFLKEGIDHYTPNNHFSYKDLAWSAGGAALGVGVVWIYYRIKKRLHSSSPPWAARLLSRQNPL